MRNLAEKWPPAPDWQTARIEHAGVLIKTQAALHQCLVSGDLEAARAALGLASSPVGAMGMANGSPYGIRLARDRMLVVSETPSQIEGGWHPEGFAVTIVDAALHVLEISGQDVERLLARGTTLDLKARSPSASLLFAGVNVLLYRFENAHTLRMHVDRGLAPYMWEWLEHSARL